ncbi:MAG TPA: hypothetical protein PKA95_12940 [Thermomicrobiales bacterium]|nr:hypothetical protein [Thermomicrobiales bacterium]
MGQSPVDDQTYNLLQVLTSKLEACAAYEIYLDDMDGEGAELLRQIAKDDERHAQQLLDMLGIARQ